MLKKFLCDIYDIMLSVLTSIRVALFGSEEITPILSVKGVLNRSQFLSIVMILSILNSWGKLLHSEVFEYFFGLFLFFGLSAAIQKRCRDFGSRGTFFILCSTVLMLVLYAVYMVESQNVIILYVRYVVLFALLCLVLLFFIPGKEEKDANLCSPLLKYPLLYAVICWILAIAATFAVSRYTGAEVSWF